MPDLPFSARRVLKATYVPLTVDTTNVTTGRAVLKYGFVQQLKLQPGEVATARTSLAPAAGSPMDALLTTLTAFEGTPLPVQLPSSAAFAKTAVQDLTSFGAALNAHRESRMTRAASGLDLQLLNSGMTALQNFVQANDTTPIGMLNLERLEMVPAGIQRGELIATIPLAPMEQTAVVQKEWSVTSQEFTSIVTDSLDNYSETGVTDDTELAQSTTSQNQHSNQFNVNATVSGGIGFVTGSSATAFQAQDQSSQSATDSTKHAMTTTKKASSRVKQSHKTTISTTTVTGSSESTTRTLQNPSPTDAMRIDYFSLIRTWHVGLYRYGLRLTYDIVIPEPAATLRGAYQQLAALQTQIATGFTFPVAYSDITDQVLPGESGPHYLVLASRYGAQVPPPPAATKQQTFGGQIANLPGDGKQDWTMSQLPITNADDSYAISDVVMEIMLSNVPSARPFYVLGSGQAEDLKPNQINATYDLTAFNGFMAGMQGSQTITYFVTNCGVGAAYFTVTFALTPQAREAWQASVWSALYTAAQTSYYNSQQTLQAQLTALQAQLADVDTLTLRREENDEITKGVLRWLLGPGFDFMPDSVRSLFGPSVSWGDAFASNKLGINATAWAAVSYYEQMVRFVNDAIDWDNILYFVYSYFWDVPDAWNNIRTIQHPDAMRQAFLRAGSARVVLTVRKGWETAWVQFVEAGTTSGLPPQSHPYLTIAQEIQDYDETNYPGIPAANPGTIGPDDDDYVATTSNATVAATTGTVALTVASSSGFIPGYGVIVDSWDSGIQETSTIVAIDATHITINGLTNAHDGSKTPFAVRQAGEKGLLLAEWFEYVPTSGTDIAVTSDLTTIS